jgi:hypothetical protein
MTIKPSWMGHPARLFLNSGIFLMAASAVVLDVFFEVRGAGDRV